MALRTTKGGSPSSKIHLIYRRKIKKRPLPQIAQFLLIKRKTRLLTQKKPKTILFIDKDEFRANIRENKFKLILINSETSQLAYNFRNQKRETMIILRTLKNYPNSRLYQPIKIGTRKGLKMKIISL